VILIPKAFPGKTVSIIVPRRAGKTMLMWQFISRLDRRETCIGMFHFGHVMVMTVLRVRVKTYFTAVCYNLVRARFLNRTT
jgi:IS5 family transposase